MTATAYDLRILIKVKVPSTKTIKNSPFQTEIKQELFRNRITEIELAALRLNQMTVEPNGVPKDDAQAAKLLGEHG